MAAPPVPDDVIRQTLDAMEKCGGNQCAASEMLGMKVSDVSKAEIIAMVQQFVSTLRYD